MTGLISMSELLEILYSRPYTFTLVNIWFTISVVGAVAVAISLLAMAGITVIKFLNLYLDYKNRKKDKDQKNKNQ